MDYKNTQLNTIWNEAMEIIAPKLSVTSFTVWIKSLHPVSITEDTFYLFAPTETSKNMVLKSYMEHIKEAIFKVYPYVSNVLVFTEKEAEETNYKKAIPEDIDAPVVVEKDNKADMFDEFYTFDNFVIGGSNEVAFAASKAVADDPGRIYNPLFIYGGVGLGKTHVIHSIGNNIKVNFPKKKILYVTTEQFINDFIESISRARDNNIVKQFRDKYRNVDVLMLDDIQFISNKDSTQEALFHAFNELYQSKRQIIFTSDKHPKDLRNIEERLKSRFQSGLTVEISSPDIETRIAILQKKCIQKKFEISREVIHYIAEKINSNIRELEGALSKVICHCHLYNVKADDKEIVNKALKDEIGANATSYITNDLIIAEVCEYFEVDKKDILSKKKTKQIAEARQIAMYLACELLSIPQTSIGIYFGRDHSTVIHARDKMNNLNDIDPKYTTYIKDITYSIKSKTNK